MNSIALQEAEQILNIYRFYHRDGSLYLIEEEETLDALFDAVIIAINECSVLKADLPYMEFIHPSKMVLQNDAGWVGHFEQRDNRRFFLSDVYDFLKIYTLLKNKNCKTS